MYLTVSGTLSGLGFELGSNAKHELFAAVPVVHRDGTSNIAWCLGPALVRVRVGDLNVIVYGFSVISAVSPPVVNDLAVPELVRVTFEIGLSSGNRGILGNGSRCLK